MNIRDGDALIVVDVQNDFLPGGALPVAHGDEVIAPLNEYLARFAAAGRPIVATRDWHPPNHCSFAEQGGPWPAHCVADTPGAAFAGNLELPAQTQVVSKAMQAEHEAYSGFQGTQLARTLEGAGVSRVFIGGLATDVCVLNTVRDALQAGFETCLLLDASRAVDVTPGDGQRAIEEMQAKGAQPLTLRDLG